MFTWEAVWGVDAWVSLPAAAMATERIRLGTLLTPVARVRAWDLASRVGTVDRLSGGRAIVGAGLGALHQGWTAFEADEGRRIRAEKLDECLAIHAGLVQGQPFDYTGRHYRARPTDFMVPAPPVQKPRPPVWVVGAEVSGRSEQPSLRRAARWDGLLPQYIGSSDDDQTSDLLGRAQLVSRVRAFREEGGLPEEGYDVVLEADSTGEWKTTAPPDPAAWAGVGVTWWVERWRSVPRGPEGLAEVRRRIRAGPPG